MVCGAHERPPGRMWGLDSGFGIRSPDFVHPDARKLALECVSTADMGDACHRRASPPSRVCGVRERDHDAGFGAAGACVESVAAGRAPHGTPGAACGGIKAPAGTREQWRCRSRRSRPGGRSRVPSFTRTYQGALRSRRAVEAGRTRRRFPPSWWSGAGTVEALTERECALAGAGDRGVPVDVLMSGPRVRRRRAAEGRIGAPLG